MEACFLCSCFDVQFISSLSVVSGRLFMWGSNSEGQLGIEVGRT